MYEQDRMGELYDALFDLGLAEDFRHVVGGAIDYRRLLQITEADAPALAYIGASYVECFQDDDKEGEDCAIHAWRAIAQLHSPLAAPALLDLLVALDSEANDWSLEEAPILFGIIGPVCVPDLLGAATDSHLSVTNKMCAHESLYEMAIRHPSERARIVDLLSGLLARFEAEDTEINASLVYTLVRLEARTSAELIERAFAAGCVDYLMMGGWDEVRASLGVPGLGLIPPGHRVALREPAAITREPNLPQSLPSRANVRSKSRRQKRPRGVRAKNKKK